MRAAVYHQNPLRRFGLVSTRQTPLEVRTSREQDLDYLSQEKSFWLTMKILMLSALRMLVVTLPSHWPSPVRM